MGTDISRTRRRARRPRGRWAGRTRPRAPVHGRATRGDAGTRAAAPAGAA